MWSLACCRGPFECLKQAFFDGFCRLKELSKPYILSISGLSLEENLEMLDQLLKRDVSRQLSAVELNVACPNVPNKPLVGYDLPQLSFVLERISHSERVKEPF